MKNENKLGVALTKYACPICARKFDGAIVMNTRLTKPNAKKVEELHGKVVEIRECDECVEMKKKAFILIGVIEEKTDDRNDPYRSGNIWGISFEYAKKIFDGNAPKVGVAYIDMKTAKAMGLPFEDLK